MLSRADEDAPSDEVPSEDVDQEDQDEVREVGFIEWIRLRGIAVPRLWRTVAVCLWLGAVVVDFVWMWPVFTGGLLSYDQWRLRMWFPSWI
jgi:hypothetical protein